MINKINFKIELIAIMILTSYMLTASLYVAVFNSLAIQIIILFIVLAITIIKLALSYDKFVLSKIDIILIVSTFATMGSLHSSTFTTGEIAGPIIFSLGIFIVLFLRNDIIGLGYLIKMIKLAGIFYALSVIISSLFPELYYNIFFPILRSNIIETIQSSMEKGYSVGFTSNSAFTAGYIVNSLGIIFCTWIIKKDVRFKKEVSLLTIMLIGLLLTQKRAHLLFMIMTYVFVDIQYSVFRIKKIKKIAVIFLTFIIIFALILPILKLTHVGETLFLRIFETIDKLLAGEDITSNRIALWKHAFQVFLQNPIYGIGWGNFSETVVGNVTVHTEMQTHNIYLQLLSETGIIGMVSILTPFFIIYLYTNKTIRYIIINKKDFSNKWVLIVLYSLYSQTFFLLYGLTGNPLYDYSFLMMYFLALVMIFSFWKFTNKKELLNTFIFYNKIIEIEIPYLFQKKIILKEKYNEESCNSNSKWIF